MKQNIYSWWLSHFLGKKDEEELLEDWFDKIITYQNGVYTYKKK